MNLEHKHHGVARKELETVLLQAGVRERRSSGLRKMWTIVSAIVGSLLVFVAMVVAFGPLLHLPGLGAQLVFSNECAVPVEKAVVAFGRKTIELKGILP